MKTSRWRSACWMLVLGWALLATMADAASLPDVIAQVKPSVVAVGTFNPAGKYRQVFRGTGFVVGNGHQVVTNYHVLPKQLDKAKREALAVYSGRGRNARYHHARIVAVDLEHDLALLSISDTLPPLKLGASDQVREGDTIAFTGFPIGMVLGMYPVTHRGIVSAITPMAQPQLSSRFLTAQMIQAMRDGAKSLQLDAIAYPGNSGSPVYAEHSGKVLGVVNSVFVRGDREAALQKPSGITYAIPVRYVRALLRKAQR